jgi:polyisoprenoid-binding protein YceI
MKTLLLLPVALAAFSLPKTISTAPLPGEHDWVVDTGHSSVVFRVKHANAAWFQGTFDKVEGAVTLDPAKPEAGSVKITIPVESVDTNDEKRDGHLKAPDFFNAKENPTIEFTSTKIVKHDDTTLHVEGELSLAGKKNKVTIPVEHTGVGEMHGKRAGYLTTFTIKRSEFGMNYGVAQKALGDEVTLTIALELVQPK